MQIFAINYYVNRPRDAYWKPWCTKLTSIVKILCEDDTHLSPLSTLPHPSVQGDSEQSVCSPAPASQPNQSWSKLTPQPLQLMDRKNTGGNDIFPRTLSFDTMQCFAEGCCDWCRKLDWTGKRSFHIINTLIFMIWKINCSQHQYSI